MTIVNASMRVLQSSLVKVLTISRCHVRGLHHSNSLLNFLIFSAFLFANADEVIPYCVYFGSRRIREDFLLIRRSYNFKIMPIPNYFVRFIAVLET